MIDIQLPDGRTVTIDTDDPQAAAAAGKKVWQKQQAEQGLNAEVAPPIDVPGGEIPWWEQAAPQQTTRNPELEIGGDYGRGLQIGSQGAGRGLAELAGAPVDITAAVMNLFPAGIEGAANLFLEDQDEISLPRITNPVGGSGQIRDMAGNVFEAAGGDLIDESEMGLTERGAYNINRFGTETLLGGAVGNAVNRGAKVGTTLERYTQPFANPTGRNVATDVAAGTGSGVGLTAAQEVFPDSPIADLVGMLVGGMTGGRAAQVAQAPEQAVRAVERSLPDPDVPGVTRRQADQAAELTQKNLSGHPDDVAAAIDQTAGEAARAGEPAPTAGIASGDIGLTALEKGARNKDPVPFIERDQQVKDAAQEKVTDLRDPNAEPRAAQRFVEQDRDVRRQEAQEPVAEAREDLARTQAEGTQRLTEAEKARESALADQERRVAETSEQRQAAEEAEKAIGGEVQGRLGSEGAASERVAEAVGTAKRSDEARKSGLYGEAEDLGKASDMTRQSTDLAEDARAIRGGISRLAERDNSLANILEDLDKLDGKMVDSGILDADGSPVMKQAPVTAHDLISMIPRLSRARQAAVRSSRGDVVKGIDRVTEGIKTHLKNSADAGDPAAQKWMEAEGFFKEDFAPKYREGVGGALDQADRSGSPVQPTATAGKFLKPGAGGKESAADLKRILAGSESEQAGMQAARDYVLADLSRIVGNDDKINPNRLRVWMANREGVFEAMPELRQEVQGLLNDVVNKRETASKLKQDLDRAVAERRGTAVRTQKEINEIKADNKLTEKQKEQKIAALERDAAQVERDIQREATAILLDTDPAVAAKRVFSSKDPETAMGEIVQKLSKDKEALAGWKRAVTDHLIERVTGTNTAMTQTTDGPLSVAQMQKFFSQHERALAKVFSDPAEMNALRRAHKMLEPYGRLQQQAVAGSQTVPNKQAWNALEAGMLAVTGNAITTGMIMKRIRTVLSLMPNRQGQVEALVNRMFFDPELAQHLIKRNVKKVDTPEWNKRLTRLLAVDEMARESIDEDEISD